ncbi:MAG: hypothetical protein LCH95_22355 [Proteobacteria bacterium]|nr:hypothetical protein [Pseudomonadota bacterium]
MLAPDAAKGKSKPQRGTVHGIALEIRGPGAERLARDFDFYFHRPAQESEESAPYSIALELLARSPRPRDLPSRKATRIFSDCVLYESPEGTLVYEYSGGAVLRVQRSGPASHAELICESPSLTEEIGYLYLQSELGRFLDEQGLHRVHALGLGLPDGRAALALIPSGGGKSTLGLSLLDLGLLGRGRDEHGRMGLHAAFVALFLVVGHIAMVFGMLDPAVMGGAAGHRH